MLWDQDTIAEALAAGLRHAEADLAAEQAVHGLDALDELGLHPILAAGLTGADLAVFREVPYPGQPKALPKESQRLRCDLVAAPQGSTGIADKVHQGKDIRRATGTLFADVAEQLAAPPTGHAAPEDALWLEVKAIGQYSTVDGFVGPNRSYTSQFNACRNDIRKLGKARSIEQAALVLVTFHEQPEIATHDLAAFVHNCLDRHLPVGGLVTASLPISDRIGNSVCTVGLVRVRPDTDGF
ncbi:MAG: hypothetical protein Q9O74_06590 [Planctomycetota bacterium]|nr:hypothetical protein [Planctomycetota bacterium]